MFFKRTNNPISWIVVFLGNPGIRFENTRHNAGFTAADVLSKGLSVKINKLKFGALTASSVMGGNGIFLMKPQTFMNLSGGAVRQAMDFYKIPLTNVIAVSDDTSLPVGKIRIRRSGSSGGHNGLRDISAKCGGDGFPRVKIGVGSPPREDWDMADWVLSKFTGDEIVLIKNAAEHVAKAVELIVAEGLDRAMNVFN